MLTYRIVPGMQEAPQWWQNFVDMVNSLVVRVYFFLTGMSGLEVLFFGFAFWFVIMSYWVNQMFPKLFGFYLFLVGLYLVVGLAMINMGYI